MYCPNCGKDKLKPKEKTTLKLLPIRIFTCSSCGKIWEITEVIKIRQEMFVPADQAYIPV